MLFLQAQKLGLVVLTANVGDDDILLQLIPTGRALFTARNEGAPNRTLSAGAVPWQIVTASMELAAITRIGAVSAYSAGRRFSWTVNPSCPRTLTAPVLPPSKSPEARRFRWRTHKPCPRWLSAGNSALSEASS